MEEWRQKALALFPYLRDDLNEEESSIYTIFFELLTRCIEAHETGDEEELERIYGFAEWCFYHADPNIWNAAGVAFYEHLPNDRIAREAIPKRLKPKIFYGVSTLFKFGLSEEEYKELEEAYYREHHDAINPNVTPIELLLQDYSI